MSSAKTGSELNWSKVEKHHGAHSKSLRFEKECHHRASRRDAKAECRNVLLTVEDNISDDDILDEDVGEEMAFIVSGGDDYGDDYGIGSCYDPLDYEDDHLDF